MWSLFTMMSWQQAEQFNAAVELVKKFGVTKIYANFFVELDFLNGRERLDNSIPVWSLIHF